LLSCEVAAGIVEYDEVGSGPPVVLLHGLLMDHRVWDGVVPLLPEGFRYIRPVLPLGAHRRGMNAGADLTLPGQVRIVADFLDALRLDEVTIVHKRLGRRAWLASAGIRKARIAALAFGDSRQKAVDCWSRQPGSSALHRWPQPRRQRIPAVSSRPLM